MNRKGNNAIHIYKAAWCNRLCSGMHGYGLSALQKRNHYNKIKGSYGNWPERYTYMDMCYDGTLSTAFGLSSWLFTEGEKHGGIYIGFDSKKKK